MTKKSNQRFLLPRTTQCGKCPWKVSTNPHEIPDGYCEIKHANLKNTIAAPGDPTIPAEIHVMACHHSNGSDGMYCVGWLNHQLGDGNNIPLRLAMLNCDNAEKIQVIGPQHNRFEDTLPSS